MVQTAGIGCSASAPRILISVIFVLIVVLLRIMLTLMLLVLLILITLIMTLIMIMALVIIMLLIIHRTGPTSWTLSIADLLGIGALDMLADVDQYKRSFPAFNASQSHASLRGGSLV